MHKIHPEISPYCFLPFKPQNLHNCLDKYTQYSYCQKLGIPYPKTVYLQAKEDLENIHTLQFPVLLKPNKREDLKRKVFRNMQLHSPEDLEKVERNLETHFNNGIKFLASEIIPGDEDCLYAYVAYRSMNGKILNEWVGKKLAQYPDNFGVFSSASNQAPEAVRIQGRKLLEGMDIIGIAQPEFKFDFRDNQYKLMEINLRSMMWHRVGNLSGVNLQYSQYLDALGQEVNYQTQESNKDIHFIYLKHEIINFMRRKKYFQVFMRNIRNSGETHLAVYDKKDLKPFLKDCVDIVMSVIDKVFRTRNRRIL